MTKPKIYFRADGHSTIGLGHVIRSLALVEMLNSHFECFFLTQNPLPYLKTEISKHCKNLIPLSETLDLVKEALFLAKEIVEKDSIVVLDGYHFQTAYQKTLKKIARVVCIDDIHAYHFFADAVINHAGGVFPKQYKTEHYTELYLGLKYALLRKPFRIAAKVNKTLDSQLKNIFVCLGGADPNNDTLTVLQKCESLEINAAYFVVISSANSYKALIDTFISQTRLNITLLSNLTAEEMILYMKQCSIAITPPSSVAYEYLSVGGTLFLKVIADNQKEINQYLLEENLAFDFDSDFEQLDQLSLQQSLRKQAQIFDGDQEKRFINIFNFYTLKHRSANLSDSQLYYDWVNDSATRLQSLNSDLIPFETHQKWFERKVNTEKSRLYLILKNQQPIGQIRFDIESEIAKISYSLDKNYRGQGLGTLILKKGIHLFKNEFDSKLEIIGYVKFSNIPSVKAFRNLGFREEIADSLLNCYKYSLK